MVVEERFNEKFGLIKEYVCVVNGSSIIDHVHTLLYVVHCNILDFEKFIDTLFSNTNHKNSYGFYFKSLVNIPSWSDYVGPQVEGCPTK